MSQSIRRPDGMRYVDMIEARTAALERRQAGELEQRIADLEAAAAVPTFEEVAARQECPSTAGTTYFSANPQEPFGLVARDMRMGPFTPTRNTWMRAVYLILLGCNAAAWQRIDCYVGLMADNTTDTVKADAFGTSNGHSLINHTHNAFIYKGVLNEHKFALEADETYWVRLICQPNVINSPNQFWYKSTYYFNGYTHGVGYF